jgi:NAD(P)-dependent dehydrogenase (short-subunit alcohol dehydrogenase family)
MTARDKAVLVIGGEAAAGRALAIGLAEAGVDIALASLTKDTKAEFAINSALNELWALGRRGVALVIDASDAAQVRDAVARAESELGALVAVISIGEVSSLWEAMKDTPLIVVEPGTDETEACRAVLKALGP